MLIYPVAIVCSSLGQAEIDSKIAGNQMRDVATAHSKLICIAGKNETM